METYRGSCHCGAVTFTFQHPAVTETMRCNCSMCSRKGVLLTPEVVPPESMEIEARDGALSVYQFGTMTARHHFCAHCGIHTFVETRLNPGHFRVNLGCVEGLDVYSIPDRLYDGKSL